MKYRLIKTNNNVDHITSYFIEKRVNILFVGFWIRWYSSYDEKESINMLAILKGEKNWCDKTVIV